MNSHLEPAALNLSSPPCDSGGPAQTLHFGSLNKKPPQSGNSRARPKQRPQEEPEQEDQLAEVDFRYKVRPGHVEGDLPHSPEGNALQSDWEGPQKESKEIAFERELSFEGEYVRTPCREVNIPYAEQTPSTTITHKVNANYHMEHNLNNPFQRDPSQNYDFENTQERTFRNYDERDEDWTVKETVIQRVHQTTLSTNLDASSKKLKTPEMAVSPCRQSTNKEDIKVPKKQAQKKGRVNRQLETGQAEDLATKCMQPRGEVCSRIDFKQIGGSQSGGKAYRGSVSPVRHYQQAAQRYQDHQHFANNNRDEYYQRTTQNFDEGLLEQRKTMYYLREEELNNGSANKHQTPGRGLGSSTDQHYYQNHTNLPPTRNLEEINNNRSLNYEVCQTNMNLVNQSRDTVWKRVDEFKEEAASAVMIKTDPITNKPSVFLARNLVHQELNNLNPETYCAIQVDGKEWKGCLGPKHGSSSKKRTYDKENIEEEWSGYKQNPHFSNHGMQHSNFETGAYNQRSSSQIVNSRTHMAGLVTPNNKPSFDPSTAADSSGYFGHRMSKQNSSRKYDNSYALRRNLDTEEHRSSSAINIKRVAVTPKPNRSSHYQYTTPNYEDSSRRSFKGQELSNRFQHHHGALPAGFTTRTQQTQPTTRTNASDRSCKVMYASMAQPDCCPSTFKGRDNPGKLQVRPAPLRGLGDPAFDSDLRKSTLNKIESYNPDRAVMEDEIPRRKRK